MIQLNLVIRQCIHNNNCCHYKLLHSLCNYANYQYIQKDIQQHINANPTHIIVNLCMKGSYCFLLQSKICNSNGNYCKNYRRNIEKRHRVKAHFLYFLIHPKSVEGWKFRQLLIVQK